MTESRKTRKVYALSALLAVFVLLFGITSYSFTNSAFAEKSAWTAIGPDDVRHKTQQKVPMDQTVTDKANAALGKLRAEMQQAKGKAKEGLQKDKVAIKTKGINTSGGALAKDTHATNVKMSGTKPHVKTK